MSRTHEPMLRVEDLHKRYGSLEVLRGISLEVPARQKVAIIGPSGSGKSTLLRVLMTLEAPDQGDFELAGHRMQQLRKQGKLHLLRAAVGMVFQHFNLFPHMTVLQNVTLAPRIVQGVNRPAAQERAMKLLEHVGMAEKADAYPARLSGGQKQRVAIARALALEPQVMLFDEVTSALDPELVGEVQGVLRRLAHEEDMTMLLVTHEMQFAREIADRILFFDEGRIIEDGPPDQIFSDPRQPRTREFLARVL